MTDIVSLLKFEEGFSATPYRDSEGYPTVAIGIRIGPKGAAMSNYSFTVPLSVAQIWTQQFVDDLMNQINTNQKYAGVRLAMGKCVEQAATTPAYQNPRCAVLLSMAYQMGLDGLAGFPNTLTLVDHGEWDKAADAMLQSKWAKQTPARAKRHSDQMRTGVWATEY